MATQVRERVTMDRVIRALPPVECMAVEMKVPKMPTKLVRTLKHDLMMLDISKKKTYKNSPGSHQAHAHPPSGRMPSPKDAHHDQLTLHHCSMRLCPLFPNLRHPPQPRSRDSLSMLSTHPQAINFQAPLCE